MERQAQTNAQLLLQLQRGGCSSEDLRRARDAYALGMQIYSGVYSGSGKPVLVHEIGTASLAHRHGAPFAVVLASMLHGSYLVGDWGDVRRYPTAKKRAEVRRVVGEDAEEIVYGVSQLRWDVPSIDAFAEASSSLTQVERGVVLVKLAEQLDHLSDFGLVIYFRDAESVRASLRSERDHVCRLATRLGHPQLGAELEQAIDLTLHAELPVEIMGLEFPSDTQPQVIPRSCRRRPLLSVGRAAIRLAQHTSYVARRGLKRLLLGRGLP